MATLHASAVLLGARALLVRGPSGAGKSRLVLALLQAAGSPRLPFARLVADDRAHISVAHGRLLVEPPAALAGLLEVRGLGILRLAHEAVAVVGWVVDLAAAAAGEAERLPAPEARRAVLCGVTLPRLALPACADPLPVLLAALAPPGGDGGRGPPGLCAMHNYR